MNLRPQLAEKAKELGPNTSKITENALKNVKNRMKASNRLDKDILLATTLSLKGLLGGDEKVNVLV